MAEPFATLADLKKHWPAMPSTITDDEAEQKLLEAAIEIRGNFPGIDERIQAKQLDPDNAKLVSNRMVKRALDSANDDRVGVSQASATTGPFTQAFTFTNPDGNMYLSKADRRLLSPATGRSAGKAFTIMPGGIGRRA